MTGVEIAGLVVAAAGAAATVETQRQTAKRQSQFQDAVFKRNAAIAERAALASYSSIAKRQVEEAAAAQAQIEANRRRAVAAAGTARTAAVEAGGLGQSFEGLLGDYARLEAEFVSATATSLKARSEQLQLAKEQVRSQFAGNVLSALPAPVPKPDYLGAALRVVGSSALTISQSYVAERQGGGRYNSSTYFGGSSLP